MTDASLAPTDRSPETEYSRTMQAKLTLELEQHLIERAERFARASGKSVSELVADYLAQLGQQDELDEEMLPPVTPVSERYPRGCRDRQSGLLPPPDA